MSTVKMEKPQLPRKYDGFIYELNAESLIDYIPLMYEKYSDKVREKARIESG